MDSEMPAGVTLDRPRRLLLVQWPLGEPTIVSWKVLRLACPCAQCQGEFHTEGLDELSILGEPAETEVVDIVMMGHYALQPVWKSGHSTGIFTWNYLKQIGSGPTSAVGGIEA